MMLPLFFVVLCFHGGMTSLIKGILCSEPRDDHESLNPAFSLVFPFFDYQL